MRRIEEKLSRLDVLSLDEVRAASGRETERARARFRGEVGVPYEDRREEDRDTIRRWARAEGTDLENEAERAKENLSRVNGAQH